MCSAYRVARKGWSLRDPGPRFGVVVQSAQSTNAGRQFVSSCLCATDASNHGRQVAHCVEILHLWDTHFYRLGRQGVDTPQSRPGGKGRVCMVISDSRRDLSTRGFNAWMRQDRQVTAHVHAATRQRHVVVMRTRENRGER